MRRIELKNPDRLKEMLRREIRRSDEARYDHRLHAVLLAVDGRSPYDIAQLLGDAPRSVYNWINQFRADGLVGLREEMRAGRPMRLPEKQIKALAQDMVRSPEEFGYGQAIWDGALSSHHLEKQYHIILGVRQCHRMFHHLGLRLLRPRTSPKGADQEAQAAFKKN